MSENLLRLERCNHVPILQGTYFNEKYQNGFLTLEASIYNPSEYLKILKRFLRPKSELLNVPFFIRKTSKPKADWTVNSNIQVSRELFYQLFTWYGKNQIDKFSIYVPEKDDVGRGSFYYNSDMLKEFVIVEEIADFAIKIVKTQEANILWCHSCNGLMSDAYRNPQNTLKVMSRCFSCKKEWEVVGVIER